jgi:hypothetical protein
MILALLADVGEKQAAKRRLSAAFTESRHRMSWLLVLRLALAGLPARVTARG